MEKFSTYVDIINKNGKNDLDYYGLLIYHPIFYLLV